MEAQMRSSVLAFTASLVLLAVATTAAARNPWEGRPPYGVDMLTQEERKTYWREIRALPSVEEQEAYWRAHIEKMQQRALERGLEPPTPPRRLIPDAAQKPRPAAPYFDEIMTEEEIEAYFEGLEALTDLPERRAFIADHVDRMRARGRARGVSLPSTTDWEYALKDRGRARASEPEDGAADRGEGEAEGDGGSGGDEGDE